MYSMERGSVLSGASPAMSSSLSRGRAAAAAPVAGISSPLAIAACSLPYARRMRRSCCFSEKLSMPAAPTFLLFAMNPPSSRLNAWSLAVFCSSSYNSATAPARIR